MEAILDHWIDWTAHDKTQTYPMLVITASDRETEAFEAFRKLAEMCKGLPGKGYQKQLAALEEDRLRGLGRFKVDIGTLLGLITAIEEDAIKKQLATAWIRSLVIAKQREWNPKKFMVTCLCGVELKNEKKRLAHARKCKVIQQSLPLLRRVKKSLGGLGKKMPKRFKEARMLKKIVKPTQKKSTPTLIDVVKKQKAKKKK